MILQKIITQRPYVTIIVLFLFSVLVRLPNLNRPLSKHHEFCTATCLRTMQIWDAAGVTTYNFNPIMTYPEDANKFINNQTLSDFDKNRDGYYKSYPPGAYLLPFFIFKVFRIYPDVLPLQIYNLLLHLLECIFLFNIVMLFAGSDKKKEFTLIGLVVVLFQLFNPCALWFHGNVYMTDMQASAIFVVAVYLLLKISTENKFSSPKWLFLLGIVNFILCYSEYLGVTFIAVACLYCFIKSFGNRQFILPLVMIAFSCIGALGLMVYQYSLINGFHQLTDIIIYRYKYQSGYSKDKDFFVLLSGIFANYITGLFWELLFIVFAVIVLVINKSLKTFYKRTINYRPLIILICGPVLLHHFIFLNASQYDFHVLKGTPAISLLCAGLLYFMYKSRLFKFLEEYRKQVFVLAIGVIAVLNIVVYYAINKPGKFSISGEPYAREKIAGTFIRQNASADEVVFIKGFEDEPQTILYAHRNMRTVNNNSDAEEFLKTYHRTKGIIFTLDSRGFVIVEKHISI